jgi:hypothetical protein
MLSVSEIISYHRPNGNSMIFKKFLLMQKQVVLQKQHFGKTKTKLEGVFYFVVQQFWQYKHKCV